MIRNKRIGNLLYAIGLAVLLTSCTDAVPLDTRSEDEKQNDPFLDHSKRSTIFGEGGLNLFSSKGGNTEGGALGVNSFLWRASLDTIQFMPVNSADPFGGVIITDWYAPPESPNERLKLNVYILGRTLRADFIRVSVFRQVLGSDQVWRDAQVPESSKIKIEDAILTKARQIRNQTLIQDKS
ncbi:MAG: DUF3576 domain-containing protein [Rhodospirillales bacterium]|nr:DUF3576 domain-containing protein [Rhodospirillales bacterium]